MAKNNIADADTTAANNTDIGSIDITGASGLVKNGDNVIREVYAQAKKWWKDLGNQNTVAGTANAITLTSASTYQSLIDGIRLSFKPSADNSAATTLNLDSLGAKAIRKISGGTDVALSGGEILNGRRAEVVYDSTANAAAGAWILLNASGSYQPLDSDLTTIAGLTATTDNFIQSKSSAWASRTPTQVTADLIAFTGDSGSGGVKGLVPAPAAGDAAASKFLKADGTWAASSSGSTWTLIGTLATTSGTTATQALGGTYREIKCVISGVSHNSVSSQNLRVAVTDDGTTYDTARDVSGTVTAAGTFEGEVSILNTGAAATTKYITANTTTSTGVPFGGGGAQSSENGITHSIRFSPSGGSFDAGSIAVYGLT